jgi:asparagine synthase (glutamine-hydrolysing)
MPGITGLISRKPADECRRLVGEMTASMCRQPFYESGTRECPELGIYGGWVAHAQSYAARLSGVQADGTILFFSGECVADSVEPEVAALYRKQGDAFVSGLNGLFSGLLVDPARGRALLFNDRYGIERLYVHETADALYFASEAKALLRVLPDVRALDDRGVAELLAFGCTRGRQTLFRGVELLPGGTQWTLENGLCRKEQYFSPSSWEAQPALTEEAFTEAFAETFERVLARYVGDGSRLGISLTGGLDTRIIMSCLPPTPAAPVCYTFSGEGDRLLDERIAARVAAACRLPHHVLRVGANFLASYPALVDRTVDASDGTFGATGAHEIYLNLLARDLAPIRLTGNFGSEVLRNRPTFKPIGLSSDLLAPEIDNAVRTLKAEDQGPLGHPVTVSAFQEIPWGLFGSLAAGRSQLSFRTPYLDNEIVAIAYRAPAHARQSSDSALKLISRDRALAAIPTDRGLIYGDGGLSRLGRRIFSEATFKLDYWHKEGLPDWLSPAEPVLHALSGAGLLGLHKYLPYRRWFRHELAPYVREVLTDAKTARLSYWRPEALDRIAGEHMRGTRNHVKEINAVITLEAIHRVLLQGSASALPLPEMVGSR